MTRLAIIGAGIAGRSLLYALAKGNKKFSEITLFDSDSFTHTCSLRSTAIVAPRGLSLGHSDLGDLLVGAFHTFSSHIENDRPAGVFPITQYTGGLSKLDDLKKRYPNGEFAKDFSLFSFRSDVYMACENAYLIDPEIYLEWLLNQSSTLPLILKNDFVLSVDEISEGVEVKTQNGYTHVFDSVIFAGGNANRFWNKQSNDQLSNIKPVQGSYLEFRNADFGTQSYSLTLDGDNLVYHAHSHKLLIGSTSLVTHYEVPEMISLLEIYKRLQSSLELKLPDFSAAEVKVGIREKAPKRSPYIKNHGKCWWIGGYYKNGYSLGYDWAKKIIGKMENHA